MLKNIPILDDDYYRRQNIQELINGGDDHHFRRAIIYYDNSGNFLDKTEDQQKISKYCPLITANVIIYNTVAPIAGLREKAGCWRPRSHSIPQGCFAGCLAEY